MNKLYVAQEIAKVGDWWSGNPTYNKEEAVKEAKGYYDHLTARERTNVDSVFVEVYDVPDAFYTGDAKHDWADWTYEEDPQPVNSVELYE